MATTEERLQILKMIEEGKISASEGAELLRAVDHNKGSDAAAPLRGNSPARWFRVRVTDKRTGRAKINVNIPIGLVNVGIKMGARFAPELDQGQHGQLLEAIRSGRQGKVIDIDEDNEHVEIFVE
ncbi:MAG: hypothetical protein KJ063_15810 [Anaerolineae bacterium]|nr:hypothetical protein [Anaerolineae bacterium]